VTKLEPQIRVSRLSQQQQVQCADALQVSDLTDPARQFMAARLCHTVKGVRVALQARLASGTQKAGKPVAAQATQAPAKSTQPPLPSKSLVAQAQAQSLEPPKTRGQSPAPSIGGTQQAQQSRGEPSGAGEAKRPSVGQAAQKRKGPGTSQPPLPPPNLVRQAGGLKPTAGSGQPPLPSRTMVRLYLSYKASVSV
jgi:hypothetical protein